jgi:hydrogenase maturation protein HypF
MSTTRAKIFVRGAVQGVGFRPFVFRLANDLRLGGSVSNSSEGVAIDAEGETEDVEKFLNRLQHEPPPNARIRDLDFSFVEPVGVQQFEIRESTGAGKKTAEVLPDIATCDDCLREIFDPANRRYLYPFTNCTNCGPRFTIIESLPYDRANTSMKHFAMCPECEREYNDPTNRRFHAQPNACPVCGPRVELIDHKERLDQQHSAIALAAHMIRIGKIVAVKGIGGFHLLVDAANDHAIQRLRERKRREERPFAVMFPTLDSVRSVCEISQLAEDILCSPKCPIVLLPLADAQTHRLTISPNIAPNNPTLGVMLPYSPLHHIIMRELNMPVVATSGNVTDEPICTDEVEARERLRNIADFFLVHNRPIIRHADDSVVRVVLDREMIIRAGRGYAPISISVAQSKHTILAVGAHLKNTVALQHGDTAIISQHIGDLETKQANCAFQKIAADLQIFYDAKPEFIACDLHPDYSSSRFAREQNCPVSQVQHHHAHILSCLADNEVEPPVLGVAWDGTGLGTDGTIWGGEFLHVTNKGFDRVAHLRSFRLPGGDPAIKKPARSAIGLLYEIFGKEMQRNADSPPLVHTPPQELNVLLNMLERATNAPMTSSIGRLFDAVASLIGLRHASSFEGQAAMELEFASEPNVTDDYPFSIIDDKPIVLDWQQTIIAILNDLARNVPTKTIAAKFHNTLVEMIVEIATRIGEKTVALSGGCFQNKLLLTRAVTRLKENGFDPLWHHRVPTNDGGIALGQLIAASKQNPHDVCA